MAPHVSFGNNKTHEYNVMKLGQNHVQPRVQKLDPFFNPYSRCDPDVIQRDAEKAHKSAQKVAKEVENITRSMQREARAKHMAIARIANARLGHRGGIVFIKQIDHVEIRPVWRP